MKHTFSLAVALMVAAVAVPAHAQENDDVAAALADAVEPIARRLTDRDAGRRLDAVRELGKLGPAAAPAVPRLLRAMQEVELRGQGAKTLSAVGPAALPHLAEPLNAPDPYYRLSVLRAIWEIAESAPLPAALVDKIIDQLDPELPPDLRIAAATVIARIGPAAERSADALIGNLVKPSKGTQSAMAAALAKLGPGVLGKLRRALQSPSVPVRMGAAEALGRMGPAAGAAVDDLRAWLAGDNWRLRFAAANALGGIGAPARSAVPTLIDITWNHPPPDRVPDAKGPDAFGPLFAHQAAERALIRLGPLARPALDRVLAELAKPESTRRVAAIETLKAIGPEAAPAVPRLIELLKAPGGPMPALIVSALAAIGEPSRAPAVALLDEETPMLRAAGTEVLRKLGPAAAPAIPRLLKVLEGDPPSDRSEKATRQVVLMTAAIDALGATGPAGTPAVERLIELARGTTVVEVPVRDEQGRVVRTETYDLRARSLEALVAIGPPAVAPLVKLLESADADLRREAVSALGRIGPRAHDAVPALVARLGDDDQAVRLAAPLALGRIGTSSVGPLLAASRSPDARVRQGSAEALGRMGGDDIRRAAGRLVELARDQEPRVRESALWAMGKLPADALAEPAVRDTLARALDENRPPSERSAAAAAIGRAPAPTAKLVRILSAMRRDPALASSANAALSDIGRTVHGR